jgi:hypothetical protein
MMDDVPVKIRASSKSGLLIYLTAPPEALLRARFWLCNPLLRADLEAALRSRLGILLTPSFPCCFAFRALYKKSAVV